MLLTGSAHAQSRSDAENVRLIDSIVSEAVSSGRVASVALGIERRGKPFLAMAWGHANLADSTRATEATVYRIGSVTKQFTAARILALADSGRIDLDADVTTYLPQAPTQGKRVTVRALLNHTSGLKSYTGMGRKFWDVSAIELPRDSLLGLVRTEPFDFEPGTAYAYNNTGYFILGMIIEKVTGHSYADDLEQQFLRPLGLAATRYCPDEPAAATEARGYVLKARELVPSDRIDMSTPFAAGALCSTVADLLMWSAALRSGRAAGDVFDRMSSPDSLLNGKPLTYGYGLAVGSLGNHRSIGHGGGINGFVSDLVWFPDDSLAVAVLVNTEGPVGSDVSRKVASLLLGVPLPGSLDLAIPDSIARRVVGTYRGDSGVARVFSAGDRLMLEHGGRPATRLRYQGGYRFVPVAAPSDVVRFDVAVATPVLAIVSPEGVRFRGSRQAERGAGS